MFTQWHAIEKRYDDLSRTLSDPSLSKEKRQQFQKEHTVLTTVLHKYKDVQKLEQTIAQAQQQAQAETDIELQELFLQEIEELQNQLVEQKKELENVLAPPAEHDERSVYIEIRAGAGGSEAGLFAADLAKMYMNYALSKGWQASITNESITDLGGYREVVLHIQAKGAYGQLKRESGVHRVQRVPATESQGRVHTSTATVAVLPEAKEVDVTINPADLRIDVFRASGAGGQHVNTTDSAVRITHIPTGVVVSCQDERSQHKNKAKAMKVLQSRILAAQVEQQHQQMAQQRKQQVGGGMRAEKVRTYNYPQNRITDHQVNLTLKKLDVVMQGAALQEIIHALQEDERENRKEQFLSQFS